MKPVAPPTSSGGQRRSPSTNAGYSTSASIAERFDEDVVPPVVAEVVDVDEALDATLDERLQLDAGGLVYVPVPEVVIGHGLAVDALADHELEQMGIGPADYGLDDVVQGQQRRGERHVDPAPHQRLDLPQFDPEPCHGFDHHEMPVVVPDRLLFRRYSLPGNSPGFIDARVRPCRVENSDARRSVPASGSCRVQSAGAPGAHANDGRRRSGRGQRAMARRRRGRRASVTPAPLAPAPWPLGAMPSTCASARRRPCAAPRSSCACACRPPWPPSSCRARRPAARCPRSPRWRAVWQRAGSVASAPRCVIGHPIIPSMVTENSSPR